LAKRLQLLFLGLFLVVSFQNCSPGFVQQRAGGGVFASGAACEEDLKLIFSQTYHPLVKTSCAPCHALGGSGAGQFADTGLDVAYS